MWVKKNKGDQIKLTRYAPFSGPSFICLSKSPSKRTPPLQVPQQGPLRTELSVSTAFFYISLKFLIKVLLIKTNFIVLSKALAKDLPPCSPKRGPGWTMESKLSYQQN
jgi:hypothetical protein